MCVVKRIIIICDVYIRTPSSGSHDEKWVKLKSKIGRTKSKIGGKSVNKGKAK